MKSSSRRETKLVRSGLRWLALGCLILLPAASGFTNTQGQDKGGPPAAEPKAAKEASPPGKSADGETAAVEKSQKLAASAPVSVFRGELFGRTNRLNFDDAAQQPAAGNGAGQGAGANGADDQAALAKKLSNPVASLISVPFQNNFDFGMGPNDDGFRYTMNFQPVIPIKLNDEWNLISRTILPFISQTDVVPGTSQTGLGDIVQSFFFSPNKTEPFIWGVGPVLLIPTATNSFLGTEKFGTGATVVILKQKKGYTVGALANHIWSVAGDDDRADVNSTFIQPFLSYTTRTAWTFTLNTESTYDWNGHQWSVPIVFNVAKLVRLGKQPVSVGAGLKCWATTPAGGPQGCGARFTFTPLYPAAR
jgi:hypothetical protein